MAGSGKMWTYIIILIVILLFLWFITKYVNPFIDSSSETVAKALTQTP